FSTLSLEASWSLSTAWSFATSTTSTSSASIRTTPRPTRRGRRQPSARWTTPTCATSSSTCTGCWTPIRHPFPAPIRPTDQVVEGGTRTRHSRRGSLLSAEDVGDELVRPALGHECALQLLRVIDLVDPLQERHRPLSRVLKIAVEEVVQNTGVRLPDMSETQGQLLLCDFERHTFAEMPVKHAHQP